MNDDIIERGIDISYPLNIQLPLPIDPRQFFSSKEEADNAVINAVPINIVKDSDGSYIGFTLPSSEEGGRDSVYYFGEPIVVLNEDKTDGSLYVIVKNPETQEGMLQAVGNRGDFYTKEETDEKITEAIDNLDSDIIKGFIFTREINNCGKLVDLNGLYRKGIKEVDGLLELCEEKELIIQFDKTYPYSQSNPLATVKRVQIVSNKVDDTKNKVDALEEEVANIKAGLLSTFNIEMLNVVNNLEYNVEEFQLNGTTINNLTFRISSTYREFNAVDITCNGETRHYTKAASESTVDCIWGVVDSTSEFLIEINCETETVHETRNITFVDPSGYGVMSEEDYSNMEHLITVYGNDMLFKHSYDINGLDCISCYHIYGINNINEVTPLQNRFYQKARGYFTTFETEAIGGLDVDERFFVIIPSEYYSQYRYLCYVKNDPCQINEFKQTFIP